MPQETETAPAAKDSTNATGAGAGAATPTPGQDAGQKPAETPAVPDAGKPADGQQTPAQTPADGSKPSTSTGETKRDSPEKPDAQKASATPDYALKLPEGVEADKAFIEQKFVPLMKELKLSPEVAQKLVDLDVARQFDQRQRAEAKWIEEVKSDKQIGGDKLEASLTLARRGLDRFDRVLNGDVKKTLDQFGLGNHPVFVRLFHEVGKSLAEDSVAGTTGNGAGAPSEEQLHRQMYPSMYK